MSRNAVLPVIGKVATCAAAALFGPPTLLGTVGGSIALNVLGAWAGEILGKIPFPGSPRPQGEPNHDLQQALARAVARACEDLDLEKLIRDKTNSLIDLKPPYHGHVEDFLKDLRRSPAEVLHVHSGNPDLKAFLEAPTPDTFQPLAAVLGEDVLPGLSDSVRAEIIEALYNRIAARFWDEVKENDRAWRAYSAEVFREFRGQLGTLGTGQQQILAALGQREIEIAAAAVIPTEVSHAIDLTRADLELQFASFSESLDRIEEKADRIIKDTGTLRSALPWAASALLALGGLTFWIKQDTARIGRMPDPADAHNQTFPAPVAEGTKLVGKLASGDPKKLPPKVILLNEAGLVAELEVSPQGEFTSAPLPSGKFWLRFASEFGTAFQPVKIQGDASLQQIPIDLDKLVEWNFFSDGNANVALVVDGLVIGECYDRSFMASEVDQVIEFPAGFSSYVTAHRSSTKIGRTDGLVKQTVFVARGEHDFEWVEFSENRESSAAKDPLKDPKSGKTYVHSPNRVGASRDLRGNTDEYWTSAIFTGMNCDSAIFDAARGTYIVRAGMTISVVGYQTDSLFWKARLRSPGGKLHAETRGESVVAGEKGFIPLLGGTAPSGNFTIHSELDGTIFDDPGEVAILGIGLVTREGREILRADFAALPMGRDAGRRTVALHLVPLVETYADVYVTETLTNAGLMSQAMQWISDREAQAMRNPEQRSIIGLARLVFVRAWIEQGNPDLADIEKILETAKQDITENHDPESREAKGNLAYWSKIKGQFLIERAAEGDQDEAYGELIRSLKLREDVLGSFPLWNAVVEATEQGLPFPRHPSDPLMFNSMRDLSLALGDMVNFLKGRNGSGDLEEAVNHLLRGIRLSEALFKISPDSTNAMEDLATDRRNLADLLSRHRGEEGLKMAMDYQRGSVELRKKLLKHAPGSSVLILKLALAHHETAVMLSLQKNETGATGERKECYRLLNGLVNAGATFDEGVTSLYAELKRQFGGQTPGGER